MKKPKFVIDEDGRIHPAEKFIKRTTTGWGGTFAQALREIDQTGNQFCRELDQTTRNTLNEISGRKPK